VGPRTDLYILVKKNPGPCMELIPCRPVHNLFIGSDVPVLPVGGYSIRFANKGRCI